jgi:hypothetical protein
MKFRKKPVIVEAMQITETNKNLVRVWCDGAFAVDKRKYVGIVITTLEGQMTANIGDWIIKGVNGEFYPCKSDIFEKTYEPYTFADQLVSDGHPAT